MTAFAHFTSAVFELLPPSVAVDATSTGVYVTPTAAAPQLRDVSRLSYIGGRLRAVVVLSGSSSAGAATLRLTDGATDYASVSLDLASNTRFNIDETVDVSQANGQNGLQLALDVDTAADSGITAEVAGALDVYHPLVLTGGC